MHRRLFLLVGASILTGCGGSQLRENYDLAGSVAPRLAGGHARGQLTVNEPKIVGAFDSDRIAVRGANGAISYLADGVYADRLPRLVQTRLVQSFENAGRLGSVGRPGERLASDYQLVLDIRAFHLNVDAGNSAEVEISVKLMNDKTGRIMAADVFTGRITASGTSSAQAILAFEQALALVLKEIVGWTVKKV
jgi:cholesterol transport system auxiliary component